MWVLLDLPGDLLREMKRNAAQEGRRLSNFTEECVRRGFEPSLPDVGAGALHVGSRVSDDDVGQDAPPTLLTAPMTLREALDLAKIH